MATNGDNYYEIDWRSLFSDLHIDWRDRGPNTSRNNVNINCPYCQDDRGFHMAVSIRIEAYSCWRHPRQHSGRSFVSLLYQLGTSRAEAVRLLNKHRAANQDYVLQPKAVESAAAPDWDRFYSITTSSYYLDYLSSRLFDNPWQVAADYDLRYAANGEWADRLLMPVRWNNQLITWIGRAARPNLDPRYKNRKCNDEGYLYFPTPARRSLIITEGPIDALKLSVAFQNEDVSSVALCSKGLNASKLLKLKACESKQIFLMLDADASLAESFSMLKDLARAMPSLYIARLRLPAGSKDAGALTEANCRTHWGKDVTMARCV